MQRQKGTLPECLQSRDFLYCGEEEGIQKLSTAVFVFKFSRRPLTCFTTICSVQRYLFNVSCVVIVTGCQSLQDAGKMVHNQLPTPCVIVGENVIKRPIELGGS